MAWFRWIRLVTAWLVNRRLGPRRWHEAHSLEVFCSMLTQSKRNFKIVRNCCLRSRPSHPCAVRGTAFMHACRDLSRSLPLLHLPRDRVILPKNCRPPSENCTSRSRTQGVWSRAMSIQKMTNLAIAVRNGVWWAKDSQSCHITYILQQGSFRFLILTCATVRVTINC